MVVDLSMISVNILLHTSERLKSISDLQEWEGITPFEVGQFRQIAHEQNLDLDTRSHQQLRKYLEMRDFERRTYMNLVAGPAMERIRLAGQQTQAV